MIDDSLPPSSSDDAGDADPHDPTNATGEPVARDQGGDDDPFATLDSSDAFGPFPRPGAADDPFATPRATDADRQIPHPRTDDDPFAKLDSSDAFGPLSGPGADDDPFAKLDSADAFGPLQPNHGGPPIAPLYSAGGGEAAGGAPASAAIDAGSPHDGDADDPTQPPPVPPSSPPPADPPAAGGSDGPPPGPPSRRASDDANVRWNRWLELSVQRPVGVGMIVAAVVVFGTVAFSRLPMALMPDMTYPTLTIRTEYATASPEVVEDEVSRPLEEALGSVPGLVRKSSISRSEQSEVELEFQWGTNMDLATQEVRQKLDRAGVAREADPPLVLHYDPALEPMLRIALTADDALMRTLAERSAAELSAEFGLTEFEPESWQAQVAALRLLRQVAEFDLKPELEKIAGVAAVSVAGGIEPLVRVSLREGELAARQVSLQEIAAVLAAQNLERATGIIQEGQRDYLVRVMNRFRSIEEIRQLEVRPNLPLGQIAEVTLDVEDPEVLTRANGRASVELEIQKEASANMVTVARDVWRALYGTDRVIVDENGIATRADTGRPAWEAARARRGAAFTPPPALERVVTAAQLTGDGGGGRRRRMMGGGGGQPAVEEVVLYALLPEGVEVAVLTDQSFFIEDSLNEVQTSAIFGGVLAVFILYAFLRNFRRTLIITVAIPISVVATFAPMAGFGVSLNIMSLGGLALGLGMLVDSAVVVLESISRCVDEGDSVARAAVRGVSEVAGAIVASTLTTICVFLPVVFVEGIAGQIFKHQALTVVFSLSFSLLVALFVIPTLAARRLEFARALGSASPLSDLFGMRFFGSWKRAVLQFPLTISTPLLRLWGVDPARVFPKLAAIGEADVTPHPQLDPQFGAGEPAGFAATVGAVVAQPTPEIEVAPAGGQPRSELLASLKFVALLPVRVALTPFALLLAPFLVMLQGVELFSTTGLELFYRVGLACGTVFMLGMRLFATVFGAAAMALLYLPLKAFQGATAALDAAYPRALRGVLAHRPVVLSAALLLFALATLLGPWFVPGDTLNLGFFSIPFGEVKRGISGITESAGVEPIGEELIPKLRQGEFTVEITNADGMPIETTDAILRQLEAALQRSSSFDAVERYTVSVGESRAAGGDRRRGENLARLTVLLKRGATPDDEAAVHDAILDFKARSTDLGDIEFSEPTLFTLRTPLEVEVRGRDLDELRRIGTELEAAMRDLTLADGTPVLGNVRTNIRRGNPEIHIRFDREVLQTYDLQPQQAAETLRRKIFGEAATSFTFNDRRIDIQVELARADRQTLASILDLTLDSGNQLSLRDATLSANGSFEHKEGPAEIRRIGNQRAIVISGEPAVGVSLSEAQGNVRAHYSQLQLPDGVSVALSGQTEEMQRSFGSLVLAVMLAIFLVYIVMAVQFESFVQPFIIMFTVPLAFIGVNIALWIFGMPVSIVVYIGIVMLVGIVVNNAIVLVDRINYNRTRGMALADAVIDGARVRLRPILITTLTTVLGLIPLTGLLSNVLQQTGLGGANEGAEIRAPMAVAVIAGLLSSTLLTLFVVPVIYSFFAKEKLVLAPADGPVVNGTKLK